MSIKSVRVYPGSNSIDAAGYRLIAYASVQLEGNWRITHIRVIESQDGRTSIAMPSVRTGTGEHRDVVHPVTETTREELRKEIMDMVRRRMWSSFK